jgi:hypothetical protein
MEEQLYRGQVVFDLSQFTKILGATPLFNVDSSWSPSVAPDSGGAPYQDNPPISHATTLGMSTGLVVSPDSNAFVPWDFDNATSLPACTNSCSVDVTWEAKAWIAEPHYNWGFIFARPDFDYPSDLPHDNVGVVR